MARTYRRLWPELISFVNLLLAFQRAARGKRSKPAVAAFEYDLEENLLAVQAELRSGTYQPGAYTSFTIHDPKRRLISAAPWTAAPNICAAFVTCCRWMWCSFLRLLIIRSWKPSWATPWLTNE